jgi:nucleoside-diphosphate-sugar epimerase
VNQPRVLVLGAGGFLGRHVAATLRTSGAFDVAIASRSDAGPGSYALDLATADRGAIAEVVEEVRPDIVVNCSGATRGDSPTLVHGNVVVVAELLAAIAMGSSRRRVVHLGSAAEYGAVPLGTPISEDTPPKPVGDYGVTKLAGTELVIAAGRAGHVDAIVLRVFNPIGAGAPANSVLGRAAMRMRDALAGGSTEIHLGSLDDERDFVDARDVADAVTAAAGAPGPLGARIVNIGSGRATLVRDAVARLARVASFSGEIVEDGPIGAGSRVPWQQADVSAAAEILDWRPRRGLDDSIEAVWAGAGDQASER